MIELEVTTTKREELVDITSRVRKEVEREGIDEGLCTIFVPHTTAAILVNEGADPSVAWDIMNQLNELVPHQKAYRHTEGNAPAHIKSVLIGQSKTLLIKGGTLALGTWQSIFFCEFDGPRRRKVYLLLVKS
jgi:secondary thiamine-phosphate synthase enzyme